MKYFFDNLYVTIKERFEEFKELSLKKKLIALVVLLLVIALIITGTQIHKNSQKPEADPNTVAEAYAQSIAEKDYYQAFEYTIIGKDGVDKYLDDNYLSDYEDKKELSEKERYDVINVCEALDKDLNTFMSTYGISDYNSFFGAYVQTAESLVVNYVKDTEPSDLLIIECIKYSLNNYKKEYEQTLNSQYKSNYSIKLNEPEIMDFSEDEVQLYIENKSELANNVFLKSGLKPEKIKKVKRYTYDVHINDDYITTIAVYLVNIGNFWYVDTTALVY